MDKDNWTPEHIKTELDICDASTRGPWEYLESADLIMGDGDQAIVMDPRHGCGKGPQNVAFVTHAREGYPSVLRELQATQKERDAFLALMKRVSNHEIEYDISYGWRVWTENGWGPRSPTISGALRKGGYPDDADLLESIGA
jgi:hypothetical protein